MNWKKSLFLVMVVGMMVFALVGCGQAEEPAPAMEQPTPTAEGTRPAPPEGATPGERPPAPVLDLATASAKLGVTEQQLSDALGDLSQRPPDLAATAEKLGISEDALREALGFPEGGTPPSGSPPAGQGQ